MALLGLDDSGWTRGRGPIALQLGLATFGILALELAIIRWSAGQVRIFAYFNNLVLVAAFLGMGLGVALGTRRPGLVHGTLPALGVLSLAFAFSGPLGIMHLQFPDPSIHLWGGETAGLRFAGSLLIFLVLVVGVVGVFVLAGAAVGHLFGRMGTLTAYSVDLAGSLLGVIAVSLVTFLRAGPPVWLGLAGLPFLWLSRRPLSVLGWAATVALAWLSMGDAVYSPYNRIDKEIQGTGTCLSVNRDFHQYMHDLSDANLERPDLSAEDRETLRDFRRAYDIPFTLNESRGSALVLGAGTGNDVQAALRNGYRSVTSVDIDPAIVELGREFHPERPYEDRRVIPVVNDARAFLEQYEGAPFDVVCYGLLDSHAMFTALSTLRLDNYMYTEEGIRAAWELVSPGGHLALSFSVFAGPWISDRLHWTIAKATGVEPLVVFHGMHHGATYLVARDPKALNIEAIKDQQQLLPVEPEAAVRTTSDDWPFLYLRPGVFPWGYAAVLLAVLVGATLSTRFAFQGADKKWLFDPVLFLMGAGFLLLEARGVTTLSLLFGSTWIVNSAVFSGVLVIALLANQAVKRMGVARLTPWYVALFLATGVVWGFDFGALNAFALPVRGAVGSVLIALPIGFAGVIVSTLLASSEDPSPALGSNLLGAVTGGCLEYLSMYVGLKAMALLAIAMYLAAFYLHLRGRQAAQA